MRGRYPGGPSRGGHVDPDVAPTGKVRLASVSEIEAQAAAGSRHRKRKARKRRLIKGLVVSLIVSGTLGAYLGYSSHRTDAELAEELSGNRDAPEMDLEKQADRLINEMWKSEALEKPPRIR
jgi:hypothetical protein